MSSSDVPAMKSKSLPAPGGHAQHHPSTVHGDSALPLGGPGFDPASPPSPRASAVVAASSPFGGVAASSDVAPAGGGSTSAPEPHAAAKPARPTARAPRTSPTLLLR